MQNQARRMILVGAVAALVACGRDATPLTDRAEHVAMAVAAKNPLASVEPPAANEKEWRGRVEEVLPADAYSYLRVACDDDVSRWVVTLRGGFEAGQRVSIRNMGTRVDFASRRLRRTFDRLVFAIVRPEPGDARVATKQ